MGKVLKHNTTIQRYILAVYMYAIYLNGQLCLQHSIIFSCNMNNFGSSVWHLIITGTFIRLNLQWNSLGVWESGMKELAEGLAVNTSLEYLDLQSNHINHEGVTYLASALTSNNSLEELGMWRISSTLHVSDHMIYFQCNWFSSVVYSRSSLE